MTGPPPVRHGAPAAAPATTHRAEAPPRPHLCPPIHAAIHGARHERIDPAEVALTLRRMLPALNPAQRLDFFVTLQREAPSAAVRSTLALAQTALDLPAWVKLLRGLARAPVPVPVSSTSRGPADARVAGSAHPA